MIVKFLINLFVILITCNISHAAGVWTNEPAGSTVVQDCPFSQLPTYPKSYCGIENFYKAGSIATDSASPVSPPNVYQSSLCAGCSSGGTQIGFVSPNTYREMFMGLMWRTNPEFYGRIVHDKMFFLRGPQTNAYFGMRACPGCTSRQLGWGFNGANADNSHTCADSGLWCYPNVGSPAITIGQWTKIEVYLKSSTTMTSRDGIVRWWINGVLAGNYTNVNHAPYGLNDWTWSETWDGYVNPVPSVEWSHYIDHLRISIPNCPAGGCPQTGGGTTPPSPTPPPSSDNPVGAPNPPINLQAN